MSDGLAAGLVTIVVWMLVAYARRASARDLHEYARATEAAYVGWLLLVLLVAAWLLPDRSEGEHQGAPLTTHNVHLLMSDHTAGQRPGTHPPRSTT